MAADHNEWVCHFAKNMGKPPNREPNELLRYFFIKIDCSFF